MHEMGVCQGILEAVFEAAEAEDAIRVNEIHVSVGELTQIVDYALQFAFEALTPERQGWLVRTGCRYIWTEAEVVAARQRLYANLSAAGENGEGAVLDAVAEVMAKYYRAFKLEGTVGAIERALSRR